MLSNTINFINQFWPERIEHWKELDEKTTQILVNSKLLTKTFESNILNVDKDPILSSLYAGNLDEIKLILSHPKHAYDILFIKDFYEKYQHGNFIRFDNQYNFIFENESTPNYIEANGYWSGDFYAQNQEREKEPILIGEELEALIRELKESFGIK